MNFTAYQADDFTRSHPVLVGERKGTTLRERLERIRSKARKANVRETAVQWLGKKEVAALFPTSPYNTPRYHWNGLKRLTGLE